MTHRKLKLVVLVALLGAVVVWQYPALKFEWDYQMCLLARADHYPNIASLRNAPERPLYDAQSAPLCKAVESERRFESAETADEQTKWGLRAMLAYSSLIETYNMESFRSSRAAVYAGLGQFEKSLADYDYLLTVDPGNYWMFENRAKVYLQMGQRALALQDYQALFEQAKNDSGNSQAYLNRIAETIAQLKGDVG